MKPRRQPDWCRMMLNEDRLVRHFTIQAMLPGLTPREIKALKRKVREAQKRRSFFCKLVHKEVCATLARWEKLEPPKKPPVPGRAKKPVQLLLPF